MTKWYQVIVYNMEETGQDLDESILEAVFNGGSSVNLRFKLKQAMLWGRLDIAKRALHNLSTEETRNVSAHQHGDQQLTLFSSTAAGSAQ